MAGVKKRSGRKPGDPKIDWDTLAKLATLHATGQEMADFVGFSRNTLRERCLRDTGMEWSAWQEKHRSMGKLSLRRAQFRLAEDGNATMQIWLGKNLLGQSDDPRQETETDGNATWSIVNFDRRDDPS